MDLVRLLQPNILATLGLLIALSVGAFLALRQPGIKEQTKTSVRRGVAILVPLILVAFVWQVFSIMSVNSIPRSTIDRSSVDAQNQSFDKHLHQGE